MKRFWPLIFVLCTSLLLILSMAGYQWWKNKKDLHAVGYIPSPDWSEPVEIIPDIYSKAYKLIAEQDSFTLFWIDKAKLNTVEKLYVERYDYSGNKINDPTLLITNMALRSFGVEFLHGSYHLFWLGGSDEENLSLQYWQLDQKFRVISQKTLLTDLAYTRQIKTGVKDNSIFLTWFTSKQGYEQIDLAKFDINSGELIYREITETMLHSEYPNFIISNDQLHLVYLEQNPKKLFHGENEIDNRYFLKYQTYDLNLDPLSKPIIIETATVQYSIISPKIISVDEKVHVIWSRYDKTNKADNLPLIIYHTAFSNPKDKIEINKLITKISKEPSLIIHEEKFILTYIDIADYFSIKSNLVEDLSQEIEINQTLFPGRNQAFQPVIIADPSNDLHLTWIEEQALTKKLYYANTKYPRKLSPLDFVGVKLEMQNLQFLSALLYFTIYPILAVLGAFSVVMYAFIVIVGLLLLVWLSTKAKFLRWLNFVDNPYLPYILVLALIWKKAIQLHSFSFLFYPGPPPAEVIPFILIVSAICGLILLRLLNIKRELAIFVGSFISLVCFYWIAQANLIFYAHSYFIR